jgi:type IV pilus assembly protein PilB
MSIISDILTMQGIITEEDVQTALSRAGSEDNLDQQLLDSHVITDQQYAQALAASLGIDFIVLGDMDIPDETISLIPPSLARKRKVLPIEVRGSKIVLAMVDPTDLIAIDDVTSVTGKTVEIVIVTKADMAAALDRYIRADSELSNLTESFEELGDEENQVISEENSEDPVVKFVNLIVSQAIQDRASDIHIEPQANGLRIRYRIDGVLHDIQEAPKSIQSGVISRIKIMSSINIAEKRIPQDGRMSIVHNGASFDLRVATLPTVWGENVVMRILYNTATTMSLKDMNMSEKNFEVFEKSFKKPHGMILVTGPTGSGKSTTLYTTLNAISTPEVKVITVEDPVEYRLKGINQVQVNNRAGMTFAAALRSILRSDPDVVLVGEIRDAETAKISIEASLTGHMVLSTLHTNDAPSSVTRLTEMGVEPFLVGSALECVVAQRLVRKLCDKCKEKYYETDYVLDGLGYPKSYTRELYKPVGCSHCSNTGYRGRIAVHEVMHVDDEIERLVVSGAPTSEIRDSALRNGMVTLREDSFGKLAEGLISIKEVASLVRE